MVTTWEPLTEFLAPDRLADLMRDRYDAVEGMGSVAVITYHCDPALLPGPEVLILWGTDAEQGYGALGNMRMQESYRMQGRLLVTMATDPDREVTVRALRARCSALIGEVQNVLRSNHRMGGLVTSARLSRLDTAWMVGDNGAVGEVTFDISVEANLGIV